MIDVASRPGVRPDVLKTSAVVDWPGSGWFTSYSRQESGWLDLTTIQFIRGTFSTIF